MYEEEQDLFYPGRKINYVAIAVVVVLTAGSAVGLYFFHNYQMQRNAQAFLAQAKQAEAEEQISKAADYLMQYLALVPSDTEQLAKYAQLSHRLAANPRQKARAYYLLESVLRRGEGPREELRREAARLAVELGMAKDARRHLEQLRRAHPDDVELMHLEAKAMAGELKFEPAVELYNDLLKRDKANVPAWSELLIIERDSLRSEAGGNDTAARMIEANPNSISARKTCALHWVRQGNLAKAGEHVKYAQEQLKARDPELSLLAAELEAIQGRGQEARAHLARGLELSPNDVSLRLTAARVELRFGDKEKAQAILEPFRKALPTNPEFLCELGGLLVDLGGSEKELETINSRLRSASDVWASYMLEAQQKMRKKEYGAAREVLEKLRLRKVPNAGWARQVDLLMADCFQALGNPDQQAEAALRVLKSDPNSQGGKLRLAQALAATGKAEQAAKYAQTLTTEAEARLMKVRLLVAQQMTRPAKSRNWAEVDKALDRVIRSEPDSLELLFLQAEIAVARGQTDEARKFAESARAKDPKNAAAWLLLFELARLQGKQAPALAVLDEAEAKLGSRLEWRMARIRLAMTVGGKDGLDQVKKMEPERIKLKENERDALTSRLAFAFGQLGDEASMYKLLEELAKAQKGNLEVRLQLGEAAWRAGKGDRVRELLAQVEEAEGKGGPYAAYFQAMLHLLEGPTGFDKAREALARAAKVRPSWARVPALEGEIDDREGKRQAAVKRYMAAIELGEARVGILQRAVAILFELGRYTDADALLLRLPETMRLTGQMGRMTAALTLMGPEDAVDPKANRKQALEVARKVVQRGSSNYRDYIFLGQMAWLADDPKEAVQALESARKLAPEEPAPWVALIQVLARVDPERAKKEVAQAQAKLPAKAAPLALAACHEILGQMKEAQKYYQAALQAAPNDPAVLAAAAGFLTRAGQAVDSEKLLRRLLSPEAKAAEIDKRATRRTLALQLALSRSYPAYKEAIALIDQNLKGTESIEDRRVKALIVATQPAQRSEAIRLFEGLGPLTTYSPPEMQFLLARLYEAEGLPAKALNCVEVLARNTDANPVYLSYAAMVFIRQSKYEEAGQVIDRLAKGQSDAFEVVELRARLLHAQGKTAEAVRLLEAVVQGKDDRVTATAIILHQMGQDAAAERQLRRLAFTLKKPEGLVLLAEHLARTKRFVEAMDVVEKAWMAGKVDDVAAVSVRVLRLGKPTPEQMERVAERLGEAQKRHPTSAVVLSCMAELEDLRGKHDECMALYRRVLRMQADNIVAMNNLAYYLSVKEGKHQEALEMITKVLDGLGPLGEILDTRGLIQLGAGRAGRAILDFQDAIKQEASPIKYFHLAQAQVAAKDHSLAKMTYRKMVKMGLKEEQVPPLERAAFRKLAEELED